MDIGEQISDQTKRAERDRRCCDRLKKFRPDYDGASFMDRVATREEAILASLRRLQKIDEAVGRAFDPDMSNPPENVWAKSLLLVPKLSAVKEAAVATLNSFVVNGCYDASSESERCCKELQRALAALDAGEGEK